MSKRTLFLIFSLFIITSVLLAMAIYQPQSPKEAQEITPSPEEPTAQTILSFGNPSTGTSSSALIQTYSLPVEISTGKNKVTVVQLELQYDPAFLSDITAIPGSFFTNPIALLNQVDTKTGRISYALSINSSEKGIAGKGTVAYIIFSAETKMPKKTAIIFLPKTLVIAEKTNESALKEANLGQFTVGTDSASQSASSGANQINTLPNQ